MNQSIGDNDVSQLIKFYCHIYNEHCLYIVSDAENSNSACFDWHNFIRTEINYEILLHFIIWTAIIFQIS